MRLAEKPATMTRAMTQAIAKKHSRSARAPSSGLMTVATVFPPVRSLVEPGYRFGSATSTKARRQGGELAVSRPRCAPARAPRDRPDGRAPSGRRRGQPRVGALGYIRRDHRRGCGSPHRPSRRRIWPLALAAVAHHAADHGRASSQRPGHAQDNRWRRRASGAGRDSAMIGGHVAVGRRDHGGRPAHHMVAGEQRARVRAARSRDGWRYGPASPPRRAPARRPYRLAVRQHPVRRIVESKAASARGPSSSSDERRAADDRRASRRVERAAGRAVVAMGVRADDRRRPLARGGGEQGVDMVGQDRVPDRSPPTSPSPTSQVCVPV